MTMEKEEKGLERTGSVKMRKSSISKVPSTDHFHEMLRTVKKRSSGFLNARFTRSYKTLNAFSVSNMGGSYTAFSTYLAKEPLFFRTSSKIGDLYSAHWKS